MSIRLRNVSNSADLGFIVQNIVDQGEYLWTFAQSLTTGIQYRIEVLTADLVNMGSSGAFTLVTSTVSSISGPVIDIQSWLPVITPSTDIGSSTVFGNQKYLGSRTQSIITAADLSRSGLRANDIISSVSVCVGEMEQQFSL